MDASVLQRSISDISKSLSWLNSWLVAMTAVVVLGLLLEYLPELKDEWGKFLKAGAWRSLITRHSQAWKPLAILLGAVLVTVGVTGEMVFEALSFRKEGQLEQAHGDLDKFLQGKSESAEASAKGAAIAAGEAKTKAEGADIAAGTAQKKADAVASIAENLDRQLADAKSQLAGAVAAEKKEEQVLFDMAVCLSPRVIPQVGVSNPTDKTQEWSSVDPLRTHSNLQAIIDVAQDAEARRAASNIETSLRHAGWTRVTVRPAVGDLKDGVEVIPWNPPELGERGLSLPDSEVKLNHNLALLRAASSAADAIVDWLHSFSWQATRSQAPNPDIPSDAVEIKVGLYPAVQYVAPPGEKVFSDLDAASNKKRGEAREKMEAERDQKFEEMIRSRTPKRAEEARRARENSRAFEKQLEERYFSQPCRLVNPWLRP
jgi:hypothetical protein